MRDCRRGAIALCVAIVVLGGCGRGTPAPPARPTPDVTTVVAAPRDIPVTFEFVAQTQSSQSVNIQARVSGFLDKRVYTEGDVVRAGQVLFLMDPKPLQAQVDAAQAQLNNMQAALDVAKFNLDRTKPLTEQNAMSQKDLDDANGQYLTSKANVDQARANLEGAQLNLSYATITSPITGITGSAIVADGTYVSTNNSQLTTVSVLSPMWVTFSLSEAEALRYRDDIERGLLKRPPGDSYTVEVVMADGSLFPGDRPHHVRRSCLQQPDRHVHRARAAGESAGSAPTEPVRACTAEGRGPAERAGGAAARSPARARRDISSGWSARKTPSRCGRSTMGSWVGDEWQITGGLEPNSVVVVDGALSLTSGAAVKPRPLPAVAAAPAAAAATMKGDAKPPPAAGTAVALPARVYFANGSATLDANAKETVRAIGNGLTGVPYVIEITGYVDASGPAAKNRSLAEQRAKAVRDALVAAGAPADRYAPEAAGQRRRRHGCRAGAARRDRVREPLMFSRFFIERPVFAAVISIIIVLAGLVAMRALPIEQYPTIIPVQVTVNTTYLGADSQTLAESVAAPIEAQINGVDNMLYMTSSSSSTGQLTLTVFFSLDTNPDIAQVQVQNRVNLALPQLPDAVTQNGVQVQKKSSSIMMLIAVKGPAERYTSEYIANYANVYVLDTLKRVPGAGQAQIFGVPDQAMRIWMNPDRMASLGITTSDIQNAVQSQNALFGAGQIGQQPTQAPVELSFPVVTQRPFTDPLQYENMILRASSAGSAIVRLKDVARAEVGLKSYIVDAKLNGVPATYIAIYQQAGANALNVSDGVRAALDGMRATLPPGIETVVALDTTDFVRLSIKEVIRTLFEAIVLVVLVVYLFLQSFRATFICIIAVFVALVGALSGMFALGYSLNLLTLFGLILAIGMVIDDAIVVVENTDRNMHEHGLSPKDAAIRSMQEVSGPVVAVVLVLCAVFIPAAFLPGTTGQLYKQFAITIVVSVAISGFVALTLTPAMCALLLKREEPKTKGFFGWFNRQFQKLTDAYGRLVMLTIRRSVIALVFLAGFIGAIVLLFRTTPTSFVPLEDQGYVLAAIVMPDAASLDRTVKVGDAGRSAVRRIAWRAEPQRHQWLQHHRQRVQDQCIDAVRHAEGFRGALQVDRDCEARKPAHDPDRRLQEILRHQSGAGTADRAASDPRPWHDRRLRILDPVGRQRRCEPARRADAAVHQDGARPSRADRTQQHVPREHAAA